MSELNQTNSNSSETFLMDLIAKYTVVDADRAFFVLQDDPVTSFAYYKEWSTIHMTLHGMLVSFLRKNQMNDLEAYVERMQAAALEHYRYGLYLQYAMIAKVEYSPEVTSCELAADALNMTLDLPLASLADIASPPHDTEDVDVTNSSTIIRHGDEIAFRMIHIDMYPKDDSSLWYSCYSSPGVCTTDKEFCPVEIDPFRPASESPTSNNCRGNVFWIYGDGAYHNQPITNDSLVAVMYGKYRYDRRYYWLSVANDGDSYVLGTQKCADDGGSAFIHGYNFGETCKSQQFRLSVCSMLWRLGNDTIFPDDGILRDRDIVTLTNIAGPGDSAFAPVKNRVHVAMIVKASSVLNGL